MSRETYAQIVDEYNLTAMRDHLNDAIGTGHTLSLAELQEIRQLVERLACVQQGNCLSQVKVFGRWMRP